MCLVIIALCSKAFAQQKYNLDFDNFDSVLPIKFPQIMLVTLFDFQVE